MDGSLIGQKIDKYRKHYVRIRKQDVRYNAHIMLWIVLPPIKASQHWNSYSFLS